MRITGKIPFTHFHLDIRFRKAIGEIISYNSTVYENVEYGSTHGHILMLDIDTDTLIGRKQLFERLRELCEIWDLNGYLFNTDNGFHFATTNIITEKQKIYKMFAYVYPYVDEIAFGFGIVNREWHLRLSKKPNGNQIQHIQSFIYGDTDTLNSKAHFELYEKIAKNSETPVIDLQKPIGIMVDTDFGFTTYPLWK